MPETAVPAILFSTTPFGVVHEGLAATLLDSDMSCAVHITLSAVAYPPTSGDKGQLCATDKADANPFCAIGKIIHTGRSMVTAEGEN